MNKVLMLLSLVKCHKKSTVKIKYLLLKEYDRSYSFLSDTCSVNIRKNL